MTLRRSTIAFFIFGSLAAGSSVGLGAFGVHGLGQVMKYPADAVRTFLDATMFQADQGIAVLLVAVVCQLMADGWPRRVMQTSGVLLAASVLLFSGSVYSITFGGFGGLAPVGGFSAMIGWLLFAVGAGLGLVKGDIRLPAGAQPHPAE
ncbi:MAG: DUF423 domain-containing protein [Rhodospirillaceae bacterium]|nr:DUF423 domain-containing protein [Rhodospirillaceae bacterium]